MKEKVENKETQMVCWYLDLEFPKCKWRDKTIKRSKFKKVVLIPHSYTNLPTTAYPYQKLDEKRVLFPILKDILYNVFAFENEYINRGILIHFNLL